MRRYDAVVRGGLVVLPEADDPTRVDVAIADGRVAALLDPDQPSEAEREWAVDGKVVLPGAIDPHVHVSWPFLDSRTADDYATATAAAARGGTTTILDFAIEGRQSPLQALKQRRAQASGGAVVDFSFHLVVSEVSEQVLDELAAVAEEGVTSLKLYMTYRRRQLMVDDATLYAVAERAAELGLAIGVHAENGNLEEHRLARLQAAGQGASRFFPQLKPPFVEAEAIARAGRIAAAAQVPLWILHLSSAEGLAAALVTRTAVGQPAALETCPQYLLLDESHLARPDGHRFLCSPPLRRETDQAALWDALQAGLIDWIGTDHCLFLAWQKDSRAAAFWECPHGLPGIETRPALILHAGLRRGLGLPRLARLLSANAARWFGLYPRKGTLLPGSDADLAVWDLEHDCLIDVGDLAMGGDWTPYEGFDALARPELVLVRGEVVASSELEAPPSGYGVFLPRPVRGVPTPAVA